MAITVNDIALGQYHADLLEYSVSGINYQNNYVTPLNGFFPISFQGTYGERTLTMKMDFSGATQAEAEGYSSTFVASVMGGAEILLPDGYYYKCALKKADASTHPAPWVSQLALTFACVRHGALVTVNMSQSGTLAAQGNRATPCKLTISNISGDCTVMGINITGITGTLIIDGITCTVTAGGENAFLNTDLTKFPTLEAGNNAIDMTAGVSVKIEYYPLYL